MQKNSLSFSSRATTACMPRSTSCRTVRPKKIQMNSTKCINSGRYQKPNPGSISTFTTWLVGQLSTFNHTTCMARPAVGVQDTTRLRSGPASSWSTQYVNLAPYALPCHLPGQNQSSDQKLYKLHARPALHEECYTYNKTSAKRTPQPDGPHARPAALRYICGSTTAKLTATESHKQKNKSAENKKKNAQQLNTEQPVPPSCEGTCTLDTLPRSRTAHQIREQRSHRF